MRLSTKIARGENGFYLGASISCHNGEHKECGYYHCQCECHGVSYTHYDFHWIIEFWKEMEKISSLYRKEKY